MATLTASAAASGVQPIAENGVNAIRSTYTLAANLSAGDVIQMAKLPAGARVLGGNVSVNIPGQGATGITVGDGGDADRYVLSATATSSLVNFNALTMDYSYSVSDTIDITIDTVASATAVGSISLAVWYTANQPK
jgi:hypothetical protein